MSSRCWIWKNCDRGHWFSCTLNDHVQIVALRNSSILYYRIFVLGAPGPPPNHLCSRQTDVRNFVAKREITLWNIQKAEIHYQCINFCNKLRMNAYKKSKCKCFLYFKLRSFRLASNRPLRANVGQNSSSVQMASMYHVGAAVLAHVARRCQLDSALDERSLTFCFFRWLSKFLKSTINYWVMININA